MQKLVLVTGASGFVGRAFREACAARFRLRLMARGPETGDPDFVRGDVRCPDDLGRAARGVDAILHLAAVTTDTPGATDADFFSTNTVGTFNVLEAAVKAGVKKVVYASSVCAVGFRAGPRVVLETDPCEPTDGMYGTSKYLAERLCAHYAAERGLAVLCLRLAMVVPQHDLPAPADPGAPGWLGAVHIDDAVEAFRLALDDEKIRFGVFHAAADGPHSKFDISLAKAKLGYRPSRRLEDAVPSRTLAAARGLLRRTKKALRLP